MSVDVVFDVAGLSLVVSQLWWSLVRAPRSLLRVFVAAMGDLVEQARNRAAKEEKKKKRSFEEKKGWHSPWDTPPSHVVDLSTGRGKLEETPLDEYWDYISHETDILKWRSECPECVRLCVCHF